MVAESRRIHTLSVGKSNSQGNSLGLTLADVGGSVPDPTAVRADVGRELHLRDDYRLLLTSQRPQSSPCYINLL